MTDPAVPIAHPHEPSRGAQTDGPRDTAERDLDPANGCVEADIEEWLEQAVGIRERLEFSDRCEIEGRGVGGQPLGFQEVAALWIETDWTDISLLRYFEPVDAEEVPQFLLPGLRTTKRNGRPPGAGLMAAVNRLENMPGKNEQADQDEEVSQNPPKHSHTRHLVHKLITLSYFSNLKFD